LPASTPAALAASRSSKACWAERGCTWVNGACEPDLYCSKLDGWGRAMTKASEACRQQRQPLSCAGAGAKGAAPLRKGTVQALLARDMVGRGMADAQCPV
jgi:hypothetical protein